jgi:hypothetical protein
VDGSIPSTFKAASGKQNFVASLNAWLVDIVRGGQVTDAPLGAGKDFYWGFDRPLSPLNMPAIGVVELGLFDTGARAFDMNLVGFTNSGTAIRAVRNQTLMEITCSHVDSDTFGGAAKKVRELRDRVVFALEFAGLLDDTTDAFIVPQIKMRDFSQPGAPVVGLIRLDPSGNAINEKFLIDQQNSQIKMYKLLVRFLYDEYKDPL